MAYKTPATFWESFESLPRHPPYTTVSPVHYGIPRTPRYAPYTTATPVHPGIPRTPRYAPYTTVPPVHPGIPSLFAKKGKAIKAG